MKSAGLTDVGMLRHENQDAFGALPLACGATLAAVCDGMGGVSGGRIASALCLDTFRSVLAECEEITDDLLDAALDAANDALRARAKELGLDCMGTTLVLALATETAVRLFWVGDSRAYLYHAGRITRITHDHSFVQSLIDEGRITEEEARRHARRNLITRAVGTKDHVAGDHREVLWETGDRILLCSDGLYGMVEDRELCEILSEDDNLEHTAHVLISAANSHGGEDNITALILENTKENSSDA